MKAWQFVLYEHHGKEVWVRRVLQGKHASHCLCYNCKLFTPKDRDTNCHIANALYALNVLADIVTPVWECPEFIFKAYRDPK